MLFLRHNPNIIDFQDFSIGNQSSAVIAAWPVLGKFTFYMN